MVFRVEWRLRARQDGGEGAAAPRKAIDGGRGAAAPRKAKDGGEGAAAPRKGTGGEAAPAAMKNCPMHCALGKFFLNVHS